MPSIQDVLYSKTLPILRPWATAAGMLAADKSKKAQVIEYLVANPAGIPADVRALADVVVPLGPAPGPQPAPVGVTLEQFRTLLLESVNPIADRVSAIEARLRDGPPAPPPAPFGAPPPVNVAPGPLGGPAAQDVMPEGELSDSTFPDSSLASAAAEARALLPSVPEDALSAVLNNKLAPRDFYRLDPVRAGVLSAPTAQSAEQIQFAHFARSIMPINDDLVVEEARGKYPDLDSIIRPWIIYSTIRDVLQPGTARYLLGHVSELLRLAHQPGTYFSGVLNYHIFTTSRRLNLGNKLDMRVWLEPDPMCLSAYFTPYNTPPAATSASRRPTGNNGNNNNNASGANSRPLGQARSNAVASGWDKQSPGNPISSLPCHAWNERKLCASTPCQFRHFCRTCKQPGHPRGDPACGRAS